MSILEVKNLTIQFGGLRAVDDFNLSLEKGELVAVIGPNGAGKTTSFYMTVGLITRMRDVSFWMIWILRNIRCTSVRKPESDIWHRKHPYSAR